MRYQTISLHPALDEALATRLAAAGHEPAGDGSDALVVGIGAPRLGERLVDVDQAAWEETIGAVRAAFVAIREFARQALAREAPGRVVVVVDPPTMRVAEGAGLPAVAGGFLDTLAKVAALDLGPRGIAVNVLVAGWMEPAPAALADGVPLGRLAEPDQVAAACEFLLSPDQAAYVNGATLAADGGWYVSKLAAANPLTAGS